MTGRFDFDNPAAHACDWGSGFLVVDTTDVCFFPLDRPWLRVDKGPSSTRGESV
jgi:hypothetical protein